MRCDVMNNDTLAEGGAANSFCHFQGETEVI
jgi:hypothetical protein